MKKFIDFEDVLKLDKNNENTTNLKKKIKRFRIEQERFF
jgi:hypothetical protein